VVALGFSLECSNCKFTILTATVLLENTAKDTINEELIINTVNVVCANCHTTLSTIDDDLTREIKTFWENSE